MKTVLVVEDEAVALEDLRDSLLEIDPGLRIIGVQTALDAFELLGSRKSDNPQEFDGIFLDIELPGMSGLQMLERLPPPLPPVVLVTAHAMMALDAFGLGVIGCLLKPVDQQRLRKAYMQMKAISEAPKRVPAVEVPAAGSVTRVLLRDHNGIYMVRILDFTQLVEQEGATTRIFFEGNSVVVPHRLTDIEAGLDPDFFFRANATTVLNLEKVAAYSTSPTGLFVAAFPDGSTVEFSSDRSRAFQDRYEL